MLVSLPGPAMTKAIAQTWWIAEQKLVSQFWRLKVQIKVSAGLVPSDGHDVSGLSLLGLQVAVFSLCLFILSSLFACLSQCPNFPLL